MNRNGSTNGSNHGSDQGYGGSENSPSSLSPQNGLFDADMSSDAMVSKQIWMRISF